MTCPGCRRDNHAARRYCGGCGCNFAPACDACGFANETQDRFCGGCGHGLRAGDRHARPAVAAVRAQGHAGAGSHAPVHGRGHAQAAAHPHPSGHAPAGHAPAGHAPAAAASAKPATSGSPWDAGELAELFAPAPIAEDAPDLPEVGISQGDVDRLFGGSS
jgi:hypothetical protein